MAATLPRRFLLVCGPARSNSVCLTFDDGPDPEHTPRLLDVLGEAGVPATFFVIGERAERHPRLVRRIAAEGHVLGHHSYSHGDPARTSARQLLDEVQRTRRILIEIVGQAPALVRPPQGKLTPSKVLGLWRAGQTIMLWNVDPKDFACEVSSELGTWFREHPLRGGDVVLLHDVWPHAAAVLPEVIEAVRQSGLAFTTPLSWLRPSARVREGTQL